MTEDEALRFYNGWIWSIVRKAERKFHYEDVNDLLQDARVGFLRAWRSYDPSCFKDASESSLTGWAYQRVDGEISDGVRRRTGHRRRGFAGIVTLSLDVGTDDDEDATMGNLLPAPDDPASEVAFSEWARGIVASLTPEERRLLTCRATDLAKEEGLTASAISQRRKALHERLTRKFLHQAA